MKVQAWIGSIVVIVALGAAGCGKDKGAAGQPGSEQRAAAAGQPGSEQRAAAAATEGAGHAAKGVKPGSHEDWCGEHAVPESQCTRCDAKLIPAFKATGDWCVEHGLPESQCLKCNPEIKIVRPPEGS